MSVGDLAAGLPVSRPAVSRHLGVRKGGRLVRDEAVGTRRVHRLRTWEARGGATQGIQDP
ncbi:hypothetical protein ABZ816_38330, partial [Actinosynnema sp. NPDC047251]